MSDILGREPFVGTLLSVNILIAIGQTSAFGMNGTGHSLGVGYLKFDLFCEIRSLLCAKMGGRDRI